MPFMNGLLGEFMKFIQFKSVAQDPSHGSLREPRLPRPARIPSDMAYLDSADPLTLTFEYWGKASVERKKARATEGDTLIQDTVLSP